MGGGRVREVVAHGGSTVYARQRSCDYHYYQYTRPNRANVFHKERLFNMKSCCGLQIPFTDCTLPFGQQKGAFYRWQFVIWTRVVIIIGILRRGVCRPVLQILNLIQTKKLAFFIPLFRVTNVT